ncbi:hypothetical protein [Thermomonospora cellulosilytica]|uniref:Uncharacterized protein n=1 Tax=Thermomonospora cellulosilytica TaxID=1411118 RepID=A0A7W3MZY8_9ACTN|nr:hypothetical protein [Thermomonospora cellulosilytica]MBA9004998.1 hypothetical protein [Thermomonospora cellulosilytica]
MKLYGLLLASLVLAVGGVSLAVLDGDLSRGEAFSAIGLNLVASVIFALFYTTISGNIQERMLMEQIEGTIGSVSQELLGKLAGYEAHYMPAATYDAGTQFSEEYNDAVSQSLATTTSYMFRGTSAKYVPPRLHLAPRGRLRRVSILMLDPRAKAAIEARAAIKRDQTNSTKTVTELAREVTDEILMSVVALFDCRHFCESEIAFTRDVAATRIELFDDAVYISWYQGPDSAKKPIPESLKFARGTFPYEVHAQEAHLRFRQTDDPPLKISSHTSEADLLQHLTKLAGRTVTRDDVTNWRQEHARLVHEFTNFLANRSNR